MDFIELPKTEIEEIKPLWELLNKNHHDNSKIWKDHFSKQTFEQRFKDLLNEEHIQILVAKKEKEIVGYTVSTIKGSIGEIDSIFVASEFRKMDIGKKLIVQAIQWLKSHNVSQIVVEVAEGNERVLPFYEGLGFKVNMTKLKLA